MQNPSNADFNRFIFQNILKYAPDYVVNTVVADGNKQQNSASLSKFWSAYNKPGLVKKLYPITVLIGLLQVITGLVCLLYLGFYTCDYDSMYDTKDTKLISHLASCGCLFLIVNAFLLLFSLLLEKQRILRLYILLSVFLCLYIFLFSCIKIHFALLTIENDPYKVIKESNKPYIFLNTACIIGVVTLLGSVIHFISIVTVFTYYNVKYIQMATI